MELFVSGLIAGGCRCSGLQLTCWHEANQQGQHLDITTYHEQGVVISSLVHEVPLKFFASGPSVKVYVSRHTKQHGITRNFCMMSIQHAYWVPVLSVYTWSLGPKNCFTEAVYRDVNKLKIQTTQNKKTPLSLSLSLYLSLHIVAQCT